MLCHGTPEIRKALHKIVFFCQPCLEIRVGMHIQLDRQAGIKNRLDRCIEISKILSRPAATSSSVHHRLRIHAQPHMVESSRLDQRNIGSCGPTLKVFFRISPRVVHLREPLA
jgi:hypothetical protein